MGEFLNSSSNSTGMTNEEKAKHMLLAKEHKDLKTNYNLLMERMQKQEKMIEDMRNGVLSAEFAGKNAPREIEKLRDELHQVRRDIAERDMAMEYERKSREQEERDLEEEIRKLMADDAGSDNPLMAGVAGTPRDLSGAPLSKPQYRPGVVLSLDKMTVDAAAGGDALDTVMLEGSKRQFGSSLSSKSKFIFPDGHQA